MKVPLAFFLALLAGVAAFGSARGSVIQGLTYNPGISGQWSFYVGASARNASGAGEWTGSVDGQMVVGYFCNPWCTDLSTGVAHALSDLPGGYRAAWLIDEFAVGLGNDGVPSGWESGPLDDATKRHALGWAVYEVGMSPVTDAPDLDDDYFTVWYKPDEQTNAFALAQAYLTALVGATIDEAALEANYDIIVGDQWVNGTDYSRWVVAVPEPANVLLLVFAAPILAVRRLFGQRSHSNSSGGP